jgi:hypothetical protein
MVARPNEQNNLLDDTGDLFDPSLDPDRYEGIHLVTTAEEAWEIFDDSAQYELGITGEEFLRRWDSGEYWPVPDDSEGRKIGRVAMLISIVRQTGD